MAALSYLALISSAKAYYKERQAEQTIEHNKWTTVKK